MYIFLDAITFRYRGAPAPVLDRLSLYVRSGEIAVVVGLAGTGKTTLLRYVGRRADGRGRVFLGSDADEGGRKPGLVRSWHFFDAVVPDWRSERWRGVWVRRYAFPNTALDGSDRERAGGWSDDADRQDLLLVDDLSTKRGFGNAVVRRAFIRDLHALHPRPRRRTLIYATRDPADALELSDQIAVLRRGRIVQRGTPSEIRRAPASRFVAQLFR